MGITIWQICEIFCTKATLHEIKFLMTTATKVVEANVVSSPTGDEEVSFHIKEMGQASTVQ